MNKLIFTWLKIIEYLNDKDFKLYINKTLHRVICR